MNNTTLRMFTFLDILAELIFLTYQLGLLTRQYLVPAVVYVYVAAEFTYNKVIDYVTTQQFTLKVYNTPLTTGYAYGY